MRTMSKNSLQALAISVGLPLKARLFTQGGRQMLLAAPMSPIMNQQRQEWLSLLAELERRIEPLDRQLQHLAQADARVQRLQTHPGLGVLTSLCLVHLLEPVERFATSRKAVAYVGLDPVERSSAQQTRHLGISKQGSRLARFLLGEAARAAIKVDDDLKRFYRRLVYRRGPQKAVMAVARKLLVRSFILLRDQIDYATFLARGVKARSAR
jgi:transposase